MSLHACLAFKTEVWEYPRGINGLAYTKANESCAVERKVSSVGKTNCEILQHNMHVCFLEHQQSLLRNQVQKYQKSRPTFPLFEKYVDLRLNVDVLNFYSPNLQGSEFSVSYGKTTDFLL